MVTTVLRAKLAACRMWTELDNAVIPLLTRTTRAYNCVPIRNGYR